MRTALLLTLLLSLPDALNEPVTATTRTIEIANGSWRKLLLTSKRFPAAWRRRGLFRRVGAALPLMSVPEPLS